MAKKSIPLQQARSRSIVLRYFPLIAILLLDLIFLAMLDALFANKKRAMIFESQNKFILMLKTVDPLKNTIYQLHQNYESIEKQYQSVNNEEAIAKEAEKYNQLTTQYLSKNAPEILDGPHPWFWLVLTDKNDQKIYEYKNQDKLEQYNDWTNCLFSRSFHAPVGTPNIHLTVYYATPKGWPEIEAMVRRYWVYAILFVVGSGIVHIVLSRYVFQPLQRIGRAIETTIGSSQVAMIDSATRDIERAYNQLARNQREIRLGVEVDRIADALHSLADEQQAADRFLMELEAAIPRIYPLSHVHAYRYAAEGKRYHPLRTHPEWLPTSLAEEPVSLLEKRFHLRLQADDQPVGALQCSYEGDLSEEEIDWMVQEIQRQAENGLARCISRSRALTQERNRFGINLATNMGHDLTNIIASGKWDLDTIRRAQNLGIIQLHEEKGAFFTQAVDGLKNNLQFLQEMVDIYRSVAYIQRPRFEEVDVPQVVRQVADLFRRSTSQHLSLDILGPERVVMSAEPRLLRMALFNLLANAYQALQRSPQRGRRDHIELRLETQNAAQLLVTVSDNGPGIRDEQGSLLPESEINRIFQSGFSTKKEGSGGGLGLAWVKSIVEEFHHGTLRAANRPEGGASIVFSLPIKKVTSDE